jgi:uncharacterized membrane protein
MLHLTALTRLIRQRCGISFAVPEIEPTDTDTRRKALPHALLSYGFGTVLIAVAINLVTNLGQS